MQRLWILEFLGFKCGENKRRRKDKRKEEPIMRKTARKLLKRLLKAERKVEQPRADNYETSHEQNQQKCA